MTEEGNNMLIAHLLYNLGKKPECSTFIDEDTITMGYGRMDSLGDFQFPLPKFIIKNKMGSNKWSEIL